MKALQTSSPVVQDPRLVELGINVIRGIAMDAPERQADYDACWNGFEKGERWR